MGEFWNHDGCKEIPQILDWWDKYLWSLFFETTLVDYFVFAYHNTFSVSFKKYSIATVRFEWLSCIPIYQRKYILNHLSSNWFTRQYCMFLLLLYEERGFSWDWFLWSQWQELSIDVAALIDLYNFNKTGKVFMFSMW